MIEGRVITDIVLDTGCSRTIKVHHNLVGEDKQLEGEDCDGQVCSQRHCPLSLGGSGNGAGWSTNASEGGSCRSTACVCATRDRCSRAGKAAADESKYGA